MLPCFDIFGWVWVAVTGKAKAYKNPAAAISKHLQFHYLVLSCGCFGVEWFKVRSAKSRPVNQKQIVPD